MCPIFYVPRRYMRRKATLAGVGRVIHATSCPTGWPMGMNCRLRPMAGARHPKLYGRWANGNAPGGTACAGPDVRKRTECGAVQPSFAETTTAGDTHISSRIACGVVREGDAVVDAGLNASESFTATAFREPEQVRLALCGYRFRNSSSSRLVFPRGPGTHQ